MKILITGGAGFLGSAVSKLLLDQKHSVTIYDNLTTSHQENVDPRANFIKGDITDQNHLEKVLPDTDVVIHMASLLSVNESVNQPLRYAENNILGSIHLLEAMRKTGVKKIIFSSSATVYGYPKAEDLPVTEDASVLAYSPYGATKVAIENFLHCYYQLHGFDVAVLRYFNPYGPDPDYDTKSLAIPNFIKKALKHQPIPLYWQGQQSRDFIYIDDLAAAHVAVLGLGGWQVFNVGTNKGVKTIEVVNILSQILGYKLQIEDMGERAGDIDAVYASSKKLEKMTGWKAQVDLEEGLTKTVEWFNKNMSSST